MDPDVVLEQNLSRVSSWFFSTGTEAKTLCGQITSDVWSLGFLRWNFFFLFLRLKNMSGDWPSVAVTTMGGDYSSRGRRLVKQCER